MIIASYVIIETEIADLQQLIFGVFQKIVTKESEFVMKTPLKFTRAWL